MTDTEKKIAEIRERYGRRNESGQRFAIFQGHAAEDIDFLFSELDREREESRKLRERLKEELVWQDECLKLEEQLQSAQQEIERLREELNAYKPSAEVFYERLQRFVEERDKLIKLLDMIKDDADRFGELVGIDVSETSLEEKGKVFNRKIETLQEERDKLIEGLREIDTHIRATSDPISHIVGTLKKTLPEYADIKEIGVTVEPDRLHDARAKIAKARFSPKRLVRESEVYGADCPSGRCEV